MNNTKKFNLNKKIVAILLILFTLLSNVSPIFAASGTGSWVAGQFASYIRTTDNANSQYGVLLRRLVNASTSESRTVFCSQHGVDIDTGVINKGKYYTPTNATVKKCCKIAYFGWYDLYGDYVVNGGTSEERKLRYVLTQQYIWETLGQSNATFVNSSHQSDYVAFKQEINNKISNMEKTPSFDGTTIELNVGDTYTATDSNKVLSDYKSIDKTVSGIRFQHTQGENTLKITVGSDCEVESLKVTDATTLAWGLIKDGTEDHDTTVYFEFEDDAQEQLYALHYNDPVTMAFSLKINLYGKLELSKLNTNKDLVDGAVFNVTGPNNYNKDVTVSKGKIVLENLTKGTYYVKEKSVPAGYLLDTTTYKVEVKPNQTSKQAITDSEPTGKILIYKVSENNDKVGGAKFSVTAAEDIKNVAGTKTFYTKNQEVAQITSANGTGIAQIEGLPMGKYYVKEIQAPNGYLLNSQTYTATLEYKNSTTPVVELKIEGVVNNEPTGKILIYKVSENNDKVGGAIFSVTAAEDIKNVAGTKTFYTKNQEVAQITSANGTGIAQIDKLPMGKYYVKEIQAPTGYLLNTNTYTANLVYKDQNTPVIEIKIEGVINNEPTGTITIIKKDSETGSIAQGDATLENAVYKVYANEDIYNVAKSKKFFSKGDLVATRTTDKSGNTTDVEDLPLGKYIVKEETAPIGYLLDTKVYEVNLLYKDQHTKVITGNANSTDKVKKMGVHIFKSGIKVNSGETPGLAGAEFTIKLKSAVEKAYAQGYTYEEVWNGIDEYGNTVSVDNSRVAKAQTIAPTYESIVTDESGNAYTQNKLPYGTYIVKETKTPKDYESAVDFTFSITQDESEIQEVAKKVKHLVVNNEQLETYIKLIKKDLKTNKVVSLSNATFQIKATKDIYDRATGKILYKKGEAVTQKIGSTTYNSFTTNAKNMVVPANSYNNKIDLIGSVVTPLKLEVGSYEITEIKIPDGFLQLEKPVTFKVEGLRDYDTDQDGDYIKEVVVKNEQPTGTLVINKSVALREDVDTSLVDVSDLSGIKFKLTAKEDIIDMADGSKIYNKGQEVGTYNLDKKGDLKVDELPMGIYELQEIKTLPGLILNDAKYEIKFEKKDDTTKVYTETREIVNDTTITEISKTDITGDAELEGAKLTILDKDGKVVDSWTSTKDSHKIEGLTVGESYILREEIAPDGFVRATDIEFKVENSKEIQKVTMIDKIVEMTKKDVAGDELEGAEIKVFDKEGNIVDEWTSTKEPHKINNLVENETYTLHEEIAPNGYVKATDIEFTVSTDKETQHIEMIDKIVEMSKKNIGGEEIEGAEIKVFDKEGKVVDEWTSTKEPHIINNLVENETYTLHEEVAPNGYVKATDIEFTVSADKETQHIEMIDKVVDVTKTDLVDGSEVEGAELVITDKDGNVIDEWTSTKEPHHITGLEEGKTYTLTEKTAPYGYEIAESVEFTVSTDKETQLIEMKDMPILRSVQVEKVDKATGEHIKSNKFEFGIYEDAECTKLIKKAGANEYEGTALFDGLRFGTYYIKEIKAPLGYKLSDQIVKVEINDKGVFADGVSLEEKDSVYSFVYYNSLLPAIQTGNETNYILLASLAAISLIGIVTGIVVLKKKRNN